jgi:rhamnogalacturonyl hydrolase YesR
VTGTARYQDAAEAMADWLGAVSRTDRDGIWWYDQLDAASGQWTNPREMSWHWGQAGIVAFLSRLSGWAVSMPVEQQSILPLTRRWLPDSRDRTRGA